jgi:hypothetical protein
MLSILLAVQLAAPVPINLASIFSPDDMPTYVVKAGKNRYVSFRATVRADGTIQDCIVERESGDPKLDALTCSIFAKRAKFHPAKSPDGTPVYGVFRSGMNWTIGFGPPPREELEEAHPADLEISTNLPPDVDRRTVVTVAIAVDENGRVVDCDAQPPLPGDRRKRFSQLVPIACQQMINAFKGRPASDASGNPVRSVQNATVLFTAAK